MMKMLLLCFVNTFRKVRSLISTFVLKRRAKKCGVSIGAARIPHIGSGVTLEIGNHASFNGFTATGWGG